LDDSDTITPRMLLSRLKLPATGENLVVVEQWLQSLPDDLDPFQILDLAYLELRLGPWGFAQPRMRVVPRSIHPLLSYNQARRMWSIPPHTRVSNGLIRQMVERGWPQLLDVPINRYGDWRDRWQPFRRAIKRPDKAIRKLKQLLGR
jgi:hypothetical protein